jgi:formylglycine-generating enzyme required for sulfatase activity
MGGQINRIGIDGPWDIKRILGTVPVEPDGSAIFNVPANTPIAMQPLDADGKAIAQMRSWSTAMPGEVVSCVGCHESQNTVPPASVRMASRRPVSEITPWYGDTRGFGFKEEVQPVLDKYCVSCHNGQKDKIPNFTDKAAVEVDCPDEKYKKGTKFSPSYIALKRYVRGQTIESDLHLLRPYEFHVSNTELIRMLEKGHNNVKLSTEAKSRLYTWIDLNTPYHGNWTSIMGREMVEPQRKRRFELMTRYSNRVDDEETIQPVFSKKEEPIMPKPLARQPVLNKFKTESLTSGNEKISINLGNSIDLKLVKIPAIEYKKDSAKCKPYWIGQFEVTNEQFKQFNPSHDSHLEFGDFLQFSVKGRGYFLNGAKQPVCRISWEEANAFCKWLSQKTGKRFSLPTDDQWEWACRAGTETPHWYGKDGKLFSQYANMADSNLENIERRDRKVVVSAIPKWRPSISSQNDGFRVSAPVGSYTPNAWGLHDMHGNVAEWTHSLYADYPYFDSADHSALSNRGKRVVRGGSWYSRPKRATSSYRWGYHPYQSVYDVGFRVVIEDSSNTGTMNTFAHRYHKGDSP